MAVICCAVNFWKQYKLFFTPNVEKKKKFLKGKNLKLQYVKIKIKKIIWKILLEIVISDTYIL